MRAVMLPVHRYVGLLLAVFLAMAGITGSLLAWNEELEAAISPQLFHVTAPATATRIDPVLLHARVAARYPHALAARLPLEFSDGRSVLFALRPLSKGQPLPNDQVFVDPYTGQTLGERRWGDIRQGAKNLMPFIYRLHYSLALDGIGTVLFGIVALLWTLDCFAGAWLTLPNRPASGEPARRWPARWWQAWKFRSGSTYKISFNLHRAGGLWTWAMLFVLAWSSVAFNLPQVYEPAMKAVLAHQRGLETIPKLARPKLAPVLAWEQALPAARGLMAQQAQARGFTVLAEKSLLYDPQRGIYRYDVRSSHDIRHKGGHTRLVMDAQTGAFKGLWLPTGAAAGDTLSTWLATLHMAAMWGWPLQLLVCLMGLAVTVLSVTGVHVWLRKRRAGRIAMG
ncbi:PepSY-associated TM helix domain-containing protein [Janthinobacterium sp. J1-1]|uniref:PepSY-associated TM helix domain-containing protein n=1 Tax=unclassified Janthinobacterium TaxID=2610881 RepID=UPI0028114142|nr:PepSY-associated TM helix domain-containing protein [Janthinobacterium sp. J1-1]